MMQAKVGPTIPPTTGLSAMPGQIEEILEEVKSISMRLDRRQCSESVKL